MKITSMKSLNPTKKVNNNVLSLIDKSLICSGLNFSHFHWFLWFYVQLAYAGLFYSIFINLSRASSSLVVKVSMIKEKLYSIMYVCLYLYINSR